MKRYIFLSAIFLFIIPQLFTIHYSLFIEKAGAVSYGIKEDIEDTIDDQLKQIDLTDLENFAKSNNLNDKQSIKKMINKILNGELDISGGDFISELTGALLSEFFGFLPGIISIIVICVFTSIITGMRPGFMKNSTADIIHFVAYAAILLIVLITVFDFIMMTNELVTGMQTLMNIIYPVMLTLLTVLGGTVSAGTYAPLLTILSTVIVNLMTAVILPLFIACIIFTIVGNISNNVKLDKLRKFCSGTAAWILGLTFGLFITAITAYGIIGANIDTVSIKAAKFALSGYVPILGGYLSEGFSVIMAGSMLIKNALGLVSIILLTGYILVPVIKIVVFALVLKLCSGIIEPIADKRVSNMLSSLSGNLYLLVTIILGVGFLFFLSIMLMVMTVGAGTL